MMTFIFLLSLFSTAWADPDASPAPTEGAEPEVTTPEGEEATTEGEEASAEGDALDLLLSEIPGNGEEAATEGEEAPAEGEEAGAAGEEAASEGEEAAAEGEEEATEGEEEAPADLSPTDIESATTAGQVDKKFFEFLKPTRVKLPQNPYGNTEYTAYALEFGQIRFGVNQTALGIIPRVQIGTAPALDALKIYNGSVKVNALRTNHLDLAVQGAYYGFDAGLNAEWIRAGAMASIRLTDAWSLHLGSSYDRVTVGGLPEPSSVSDLLVDGSSDDLAAWEEAARNQGIELKLEQSMVTARFATDYRFNRRDALVFQASAILQSAAQTEITGLDPTIEEGLSALPPLLNMDNILLDESDFQTSVAESYVASLAYQRSGKHLDIRLGLGISSIQYAWLLQSVELSYHFGGKTRREETKLKKNWRRNKRVDG